MVMEDNTRYITNRIWNKILPPSLICDLFIMIVLFIGLFFLVSRFCPKQELVVYSTFLPFWCLVSILECFFAAAGPQYFTIFKGASKHSLAQQVFSEVLTTQILLIAAATLLAIWQMPLIVRFLGLPQELVPLGIRYGRLLFCYGLTDTLTSTLRHFVQADSMPRTGATIASVQATVLFLGMYICFVVLHTGLMGYYYFALSCTVFSVSVYLSLFLCGKTTLQLRGRLMRRQTFRELVKLSSNGIVNNAGGFLNSVLATRWLMTVFGPPAVTIFALLSTLTSCGDYFMKGFITSTQSLVGIYRGEENNNGIRISCRKGFFSGLYLQIGFMLVLVLFPEQLCSGMHVLENFPGEAVWAIRLFAMFTILRYAYTFFSSYYVICGYNNLIIFCSVVGDICSFLLSMTIFFLILRDEHLCWWYHPAATICMLLVAFLTILWKKRRGKFQSFLLLPQRAAVGKRYHFLLKNRAEDFQDYRTMLNAFLHKQSVEPKNTARSLLLFEELFLFAGERIGRQNLIAFSITVLDDKVELALRYDSRESCLKSVLNGKMAVLDPERIAGAKILSRLSDNIYIDRIYGINYIRLTLNRA